MSRSEDKRRHPRVTQRLPVRSRHNGGVDLETIDLSAGGLFCTSPAYLPPMTKMALALQLPASGGTGPSVVEGEAVVVRTDPPHAAPSHLGGYRIALFFSRMEDEHRRRLQAYLQSRSQ